MSGDFVFLTDLQSECGFSNDDFHNMRKRGCLSPDKVPPGSPGRDRVLGRHHAMAIATAAKLDDLGVKPAEIRQLIDWNADTLLKPGDVFLLVTGDPGLSAVITINEAEIGKVFDKLLAQDSFRAVNLGAVRRCVDRAFERTAARLRVATAPVAKKRKTAKKKKPRAAAKPTKGV